MKFFRFAYSALVLVFMAGSLQAKAPWGILKNVTQEEPSSSLAVDYLIYERPIHYALDQEITPQEEQLFRANIQKWPQETLQMIQKKHRTKEFRNIIPLLEHKLVLEKVSLDTPPDIYLTVQPDPQCPGAAGCFKFKKSDNEPYSVISIIKAEPARFSGTLLHEIGHYFGLGDQYENRRHLSSSETYSSDVNLQEGAVMNNSQETNGHITCDDADGFINLLDFRLAQLNDNQFSARANEGWKSLCPSSKNIYQNAKTINRNASDSYDLYLKDDRIIVNRKYYDGNQIGETRALVEGPLKIFSILPTSIVTMSSKLGLVASIQDKLGYTFYPSTDSSLVWKRDFAYPISVKKGGQEVISIVITEYVNGAPMAPYLVDIHRDGSISGNKTGTLNASFYEARTSDYTISFKLKNGKIESGQITDKIATVEWDLDVFTLTLRQEGKEPVVCPAPPNENCDNEFNYYFSTFQQHQKHLESFYKNFHAPLFKVNQKDINKELKKSLSKR